MTAPLDRLAEMLGRMTCGPTVGVKDLRALVGVAPELIAVARAAEGLTFTPGIEQLRPLRDALYALNVKLAAAVKA